MSLLLLWGSTNGHFAFAPILNGVTVSEKFSCLVPKGNKKLERIDRRLQKLCSWRGRTLTTSFKVFWTFPLGSSSMNRVSWSKFWLTLLSLVQGFCMSRHPQPHQSHLSPVLHMYPLLHHLEPPAVQWIYCSFFLTLLGFWAYSSLFCSNAYLYHLTPTTTTTLNLAQSSLSDL